MLDARHGPGAPAVVMLMREQTAKEAAWFCRGRSIPAPVTLPALPPEHINPRNSVNQLSEGFVNGMQANLPSIVFTILRTASALAPFPWNDAAQANAACGSTASASGKGAAAVSAASQVDAAASSNGDHAAGSPFTPLCSICSTPLTPLELEQALADAAASQLSLSTDTSDHTATSAGQPEPPAAAPGSGLAASLRSACCSRCNAQIRCSMKAPAGLPNLSLR